MRFDLVEQPWILVQRLDGRVEEVSLLGLVERAHVLRSIVGEVPTQEFALLRLLLAVLHRATDGPTTAGWTRLWAATRLPAVAVADYLSGFRERFDLLHPRTPFYQVAELRTARDEVFGLERLIADAPTGAPFLTNRCGPGLRRITPAEAARWVVHCQAYDVSGIKSGAVGDGRVKGGKGYPIGTGFAGTLGGLAVEGDTLRETLLLNLVPADLPYVRRDPDDAPVWELDPLGPAERTDGRPLGVLGLYTWQSRRIRLVADHDGITGVLITNGDRLPPQNLHDVEPLTAWRRSPTQEKALKLSPVYLPRTHVPGRALWRGLASMLPGTAGRSRRDEAADSLDPGVLEWLGAAVNREFIAPRLVRLRAYGAVYGTQQSVIDDIVEDAVTMPVRALADRDTAVTVQDATRDAEDGVRELTRLAADLVRAAGVRDDLRVAGVRDRAAEQAYGALDEEFRAWLADLAGDDLAAARARWQRTVARLLRDIGDRMVAGAGPVAWAGREVDGRHVSSALADVRFRRALTKALPLAADSATTGADAGSADADDNPPQRTGQEAIRA